MYAMTRGDRALAEDLVQEAFLAAAQNWATFRTLDDDLKRAWLFRVARNKAIDVFRHNKVVRRHLDVEAVRLEDAAVASGDVHELAISSLTLKRLWEAIGNLPRSQQLLCFLRYRAGMSNADIADLLGCSTGNVSSQLSTATRRLMAEIDVDPVCGSGSSEGGQAHG